MGQPLRLRIVVATITAGSALMAIFLYIIVTLVPTTRNYDFGEDLDTKIDVYKLSINEVNNIKYILLWTSRYCVPLIYMGKGQQVFIIESCRHINCYVTDDRANLEDITKFDVVVFNGPQLLDMNNDQLPRKRSSHQKYVFASIESPHYYPISDSSFDGYFNWTWTYKLDSDLSWGYITIRNAEGDIIGPNKIMHWMKRENMEPVSNELMTILVGKTKAAAWFVSNCNTLSKRELFVLQLQMELNHYGLKIDIYGKCGLFDCDRSNEKLCNKLVEKHYFFYLALENAFSEDYVTEKIVHGLQNSAIPIVYGGANYTRFLPDGSYLNARELGIKMLAAEMNYLIHNIKEYSKYFKWRNHYSYHTKHATAETNDYCGICALLNDETKIKQRSVYKHFLHWWNRKPSIMRKAKCMHAKGMPDRMK